MEDYEIVSKLGQGASASVFLISQKETGKLFALKKILLDDSRKTRQRDAVLQEATILKKLCHPYIVAHHESFISDEEKTMYIIQDYCDGGTLGDKIIEVKNKETVFPEKTIMQWFIEIAMAVQYIHSQRILHRDLKPQNVLVTKKGTLKLADFGISKSLDSTTDMAQTVIGTPFYLSPELCHNRPYSSKADIWALGCLLYELCELKPPFDSETLVGLIFRIIARDFQPLSDQFSEELRGLVDILFAVNPEERPSATSILSHPYVREQLDLLVEEKEYHLQQKVVRERTDALGIPSQNSGSASPMGEETAPPVQYEEDFEEESEGDEEPYQYEDDFEDCESEGELKDIIKMMKTVRRSSLGDELDPTIEDAEPAFRIPATLRQQLLSNRPF